MLDWFKSVFLGALGPVLSFFNAVLNPLVAIVLGIWAVIQFVYALLGKAWDSLLTMKTRYAEIMDIVGESVFGQLPNQLSQGVGYFNSFVPLTEALLLAAQMIIFYTLSTIVRVIKAWVPTIG